MPFRFPTDLRADLIAEFERDRARTIATSPPREPNHQRLGQEHVLTGKPIVVHLRRPRFQIAAPAIRHSGRRLSRMCEIARKCSMDGIAWARVIAARLIYRNARQLCPNPAPPRLRVRRGRRSAPRKPNAPCRLGGKRPCGSASARFHDLYNARGVKESSIQAMLTAWKTHRCRFSEPRSRRDLRNPRSTSTCPTGSQGRKGFARLTLGVRSTADWRFLAVGSFRLAVDHRGSRLRSPTRAGLPPIIPANTLPILRYPEHGRGRESRCGVQTLSRTWDRTIADNFVGIARSNSPTAYIYSSRRRTLVGNLRLPNRFSQTRPTCFVSGSYPLCFVRPVYAPSTQNRLRVPRSNSRFFPNGNHRRE